MPSCGLFSLGEDLNSQMTCHLAVNYYVKETMVKECQ